LGVYAFYRDKEKCLCAFFVRRFNGQDEELKQASIYGVAQMARHAPRMCFIPHSEYYFSPSLHHQRSKGGFGGVIFENAVSALASLLLIETPVQSTSFVKHDTEHISAVCHCEMMQMRPSSAMQDCAT
jgi:hypothetical protein